MEFTNDKKIWKSTITNADSTVLPVKQKLKIRKKLDLSLINNEVRYYYNIYVIF